QDWVGRACGRHLLVQTPFEGHNQSYVGLPISQVPFRRMDVEKLPEFFDWAGYEPGARPSAEQLAADLVRWDEARERLTAPGRQALQGSYRTRVAAAAQTAQHLAAWEGSVRA